MEPSLEGMKLLQVGKVKEVYQGRADDELVFYFTDKISVFDKVIPNTIPRKGESLCRTSAHWFRMSDELGVPSHFIDLMGPSTMRVKKVKVERDMSKLTHGSTSVLIPLEFISRYYVAGSLLDRLKKGKITMESVGFPGGHTPKYGELLPEPIFEATTKLEEVDRPVTMKEAMELARLTRSEWDDVWEAVRKVDDFINSQVESRGLIHVDGKKEFGFDPERRIMLIDTFATADEDRFWDTAELAQGRRVELSKEAVRQFYRGSGYHRRLMEARDAGMEEPPIPALPEDEVAKVTGLYSKMFERLTGERF